MFIPANTKCVAGIVESESSALVENTYAPVCRYAVEFSAQLTLKKMRNAICRWLLRSQTSLRCRIFCSANAEENAHGDRSIPLCTSTK